MTKAKDQKNQDELFSGQQVLDDLMKKRYEELSSNAKKNAKIGELLKMIEFRNKKSPAAEQKKFWDMLDAIRREEQSKAEKNDKSTVGSGNAMRRRKSDSSSC